MSVLNILTDIDGSAGRDKADLDPIPELDHYLPATEWNNVKKGVVQLTAAVGLGTGGTVGSLEEKIARGVVGLDKAIRWVERDDFNPAKTVFPYSDSGAAFSVHLDVVSDAVDEGHGIRELATTVVSARETPIMFSGGDTDLIVRVRFKPTSTIASLTTLLIGVGQVGGTTFGIHVGVFAGAVLGVFLESAAGAGGGQQISFAPAAVIDTWYEIEVRINNTLSEATATLDGTEVVGPIDVTNNVPEATEDMGFSYRLAPSAGTASVEVDYIEVEGTRL